MNRASAACVGSAVCQSVRYLAAWMACATEAGATTNPTRSVASIVFENEPT